MDFAKAQTIEERLLLTLIQKLDDKVNKLLHRDGHSDGNVLEGWAPPGGLDEKQEAR